MDAELLQYLVLCITSDDLSDDRCKASLRNSIATRADVDIQVLQDEVEHLRTVNRLLAR